MFKKVRSKILAMVLAFFMITGFMPANFGPTAQAFPGAVYDYNLIYNGDAEADDVQMVGWTEPTSPYFTVITEESSMIPPPNSSDGGNVFDLYTIGLTQTDSISQTIDIFNLSDDIAAGLVNVELSAEARKLKADSVHTLTMELLDDSAEVLYAHSESGISMGDNVAAEWQDIIISQDSIAANTASIRITLTGAINTTDSGDFVEFDGVSLILTKEVPSTPAPAVTTINPNSGPTAGGTSVTITGTDFTGATAVNFGSAAAASYIVDSVTQITAVSPLGTAGTVDVTVTTAAGTSAVSASDQFTYVAPPAPTLTAFEVVATLGSVSANLLGVYYENGTVNGRPCYEGPNGFWISYGKWVGTPDSYWFIGTVKGDSDLNGTAYPIYYLYNSGMTPPINTNFTPGQNPGTGSKVALRIALPPEMNIKGNGISISDGDSVPSGADNTDFGSATVGEIITKTYTIENTGQGLLRLSGTPIVSVSGTNAAEFSVIQPASSVAAGSNITFTVNFAPKAAGTRTAAISIINNDQDENPYNFAIQGSGIVVPAPVVTTDAATGVDFTEATLNGTVNANGASTTVSFEYGLTTAYGSTVSAIPSPLSGSDAAAVSAVISGLTPYTTYHYRVKAVNAGGSSSGADQTFTTGAAITYNDVTKTYGDPGFIHTASGGSSTGAFSYASSNPAVAAIDAATGSVTILKAGTTTLTANKAGDGNFSSDSQTCTLKINKVGLTATVGDYSRNYGDANPAFAVNVTGFINGETAETAAGYAAPTASSTATATTAQGTALITITGGAADSYTFNTSDTGVLTIGKAILTATVGDYNKTYGQANPTFTVNVTGFKNGETSATAAGYTAPTAGCEATAATSPGTAAITISGGSANNYTFDISDTGVLTIGQAVLTATVGDYSKTYGEANPVFEVNVTGFINGDTAANAAGYAAPMASSTATVTTGTGTAAITISGGAADNYTFNISDTGVLTINKALLTAIVGDYSRSYGDANPAFAVDVSGFKNGETSANAAGYAAPTASSTATATTAQGTALITITGGAADNYTFNTSDSGVLTINTAMLTATVENYSKTYGQANPAFAVDVTGFKNGENSTTAAGYAAPTASSTATAATAPGTAAITINGGAADNYTFDISDTGVLTIGQAVLTATVGDYSKTYGEANPVFEVNVTGFVNGDTAATASGYTAPTAGSTATAESGAGTAEITISGGAADYYTFDTSDQGILTIEPRELTVTAHVNTKYYDGSADATGFIYLTGIIFDDEVTATGIFTFEDGKTGRNKTVYVTGISLAGADAANYWVIDNTTLKADITVESNGGDYEPPTRPDQKQIEILVNGKTETAATATTTSVNGQTVTTILLDAQKVAEKLEQAGKRAVVTILAPKDSEVLVGQLTGQTVKNLEKYQAVLEIKNGDVTYTLPAAQLNIDEIAARLGNPALKDIIVSIKIARPSEGTLKNLQDKADKNGYKLMMEPIEFTITCKSGSRTTSVAKFASYVERTVAISEETDPGKITTAAVFNQDGSLAHVPTKIIKRDGKYYARISSLSNSIYTLIYNPRAFADMENHWAEQAVNDMGSRLVISGVSENKFEPGRAITRAEFAAIMVRGLGLKPENGSQIFSDVDSAQWYSSYINAAYQYGIISGYGEGTFGPTDKITREQAMSMIARAMNITGLDVEFGAGEAEALLAQFTDVSEASGWAQTSIAECIKAGIITGQGSSLLAAKAEITRAEVAVIIKKLLQQSDLI